MSYEQGPAIKQILDGAKTILVIQAENPDGDSLASSLAMEAILHEIGKEPVLFCSVAMPRHLRHLSGWDRVTNEFPRAFDAAILLDVSTDTLLTNTMALPEAKQLKSKPVIVIDHHGESEGLSFEATMLVDSGAVATGQVIYELAQQLEWPLNDEARERIASSIMYDSLGMSSVGTTARTIHIIGELVEQGVSLAKLDDERRELMRRAPQLTAYKGRLLQRIEYHADGQIATVDIPWEEIEEYSDQYNPPMLVIDDMRMTEGVQLAIAFKSYPDGKITGKLRANRGAQICDKLAAQFGGGGHPYAAGFKVFGKELPKLKAEVVAAAAKLLREQPDATA